jgi:hypothetical protein
MARWIAEVIELLVGGKILIIFDLGTMWGLGGGLSTMLKRG